jgi:hypothetical protein
VNLTYLQIYDSAYDISQKEFQKTWNEHLLSILTYNDKLIIQGPCRWIVMSKSLSTQTLMNHVQSLADIRGARVISKNIIYPDNGINVMNYIFTGPEIDKI